MSTTHSYVSARQQEAGDAEQRLVDCMEDMAQWMVSSRLKMSPAKTDLSASAPAEQGPHVIRWVCHPAVINSV